MSVTETEITKQPSGLPSRYRDYDARFKAAAIALLEANGGKLRTTAKQLNMPVPTLRRWKNGQGFSDETLTLQPENTRDLASAIESIAWQIVDAMPGKIPGAGLRDAAIALGTSIDKVQLLRGQPTSISGSVMSEDERRLRVAELLAGIQARAGHNDAAPVLNVPTDSHNMT